MQRARQWDRRVGSMVTQAILKGDVRVKKAVEIHWGLRFIFKIIMNVLKRSRQL
jgi:hypothetical protein